MNDGTRVATLLRGCGRFGDILELTDESPSAVAKAKIAQFVETHRGKGEIGEVFFYYSGHSGLIGDDFGFLFSDYVASRKTQTSLLNTELDSMLRALAPKLTVKVVDACHSGTQYVKDAAELSANLQKSKTGLSDCYFMFSSLSHQSSYQDDDLSDFTRAFLESVAGHQSADVRYKDIIDYISDKFQGNSDQTPIFVVQAPCTEVFCQTSAATRMLLGQKLPSTTAPKSVPTLEGVARERAKEYCTRDEALAFLESMRSSLKGVRFTGDLANLYELTPTFLESYDGVPNRKAVAKWLAEEKGSYFASITLEQEVYYERKPSNPIFSHIKFEDSESEGQQKFRRVPVSFDLTTVVPFRAISVAAIPTLENLPQAALVVVFVLSKKDCVIFDCIQEIAEQDWGKSYALSSTKWAYTTTGMKQANAASQVTAKLLKKFEEFLTTAVRRELGLSEPQSTPAKPPDAPVPSSPTGRVTP